MNISRLGLAVRGCFLLYFDSVLNELNATTLVKQTEYISLWKVIGKFFLHARFALGEEVADE